MSVKWPEIQKHEFCQYGLGTAGCTCGAFAANKMLEACKRAYEQESNVSPHKLHEMANGDTAKYIELMKAHGYIIPKKQEPKMVPLDKDFLENMEVKIEYGQDGKQVFLTKESVKMICETFGKPKVTVPSVHDIWVWIRALKSGGNEDCSDEEIAQAIHDRLNQ